jgi:hypothetical protein
MIIEHMTCMTFYCASAVTTTTSMLHDYRIEIENDYKYSQSSMVVVALVLRHQIYCDCNFIEDLTFYYFSNST